jgi:hypothetical protein
VTDANENNDNVRPLFAHLVDVTAPPPTSSPPVTPAVMGASVRPPKRAGWPSETATLAEVKLYLEANLKAGTSCPACGRTVKINPVHLVGNKARILIALYQATGGSTDAWVHAPTYLREHRVPNADTGDTAKLLYWKLLEYDDSNGREGYYRLTALGRDFVEGRVRVRRTVYIYNAAQVEVEDDGETVSIHECSSDRFNVEEALAAVRGIIRRRVIK